METQPTQEAVKTNVFKRFVDTVLEHATMLPPHVDPIVSGHLKHTPEAQATEA